MLKALLFLLIFSDIYLYYMEPAITNGYSPRVVLILPLLFFAIVLPRRFAVRTMASRPAIGFLFMSMLLFSNVILVDFFSDNVQLEMYLTQFGYALCLLFVTVTYFYDQPEKAVVYIALLVTLSSVVAIGQGMGVSLAWQVRYLIEPWEFAQLNVSGRVPGLDKMPYMLAASGIVGFSCAWSLFALRFNRHYRFWGGCCLLIVLSGFYSGTRSMLLSCFAVVGISGFLLGFRNLANLIGIRPMLVVLAMFFGMFVYSTEDSVQRIFQLADNSAVGRIGLVASGLLVFMNNPLGVGTTGVSEAVNLFELSRLVDYSYMVTAGLFEPHNYIVDVLAWWGIQGMILVLAIHVLLVRVGYLVWKISNDAQHRMISFVALTTWGGVITNSMTHNQGLYLAMTYLMIIVGLQLVVFKKEQDIQNFRNLVRSTQDDKAG